MPITSGKYEIGPADGYLHLLTTRKGAAAALGHDLTIEAKRWNGTVVIDTDDPTQSNVNLTVDMASLEVLEGRGGAKPLSSKDKENIRGSINDTLKTKSNPEMTFASDSVEASGDSATVTGTLTLVGKSGPASVTVTFDDAGRAQAKATVVQTDFGIKLFTGMMGMLKLADEVNLDLDTALRPS